MNKRCATGQANACRYGKTNSCSARAALRAPTYILWSTTAHQFKTPKGFRCGCTTPGAKPASRDAHLHLPKRRSPFHQLKTTGNGPSALPKSTRCWAREGEPRLCAPLSQQDPPPPPICRAAAQLRVALIRSTTLQRERARQLCAGRAGTERAGRGAAGCDCGRIDGPPYARETQRQHRVSAQRFAGLCVRDFIPPCCPSLSPLKGRKAAANGCTKVAAGRRPTPVFPAVCPYSCRFVVPQSQILHVPSQLHSWGSEGHD